MHWIETSERLYARAVRRKGMTIPTTDCIVAAAAESIGGDIPTLDGHFDDIDSLTLLWRGMSTTPPAVWTSVFADS